MEVERGQSAFVDASLIAPILIMILVIGYTIASSNTTQFMYERGEKRYVEDLTYSLLRSTVREVHYYFGNNLIILEDKTVEQLISEDLYLRYLNETSLDISSLKSGVEDKINATLYQMTSPIYHYSLFAQYKNVNFTIGWKKLPDTRYSYDEKIDMPNTVDKGLIILYIWEVK